tara:strand:+ start:501 stop:797 length:297 start_codon:yes stop_codon:yes gene_type:complete
MPLGNPNQGQQQWALINELVRKDEEREEENKKLDLGEILSLTNQTEAANSQELERREAERQRLRQRGQIDFNQREEEDRNLELNRRVNQQFPMSSEGF